MSIQYDCYFAKIKEKRRRVGRVAHTIKTKIKTIGRKDRRVSLQIRLVLFT